MMPTATCRSCGWRGPADLCGPLGNAWERVGPGEVMPAGECPACNASARIDDDRTGPRIAIVTVPAPERATHFPFRATASALAGVMARTAGACNYRVQHIEPHGVRVAVYRPNPIPQMVPDGYLRIEPG